jgi:hydrogenase-4 component B
MNEWLVVAGIVLAAVSGVPGLALSRQGTAGERLATALLGIGAALASTGAILTFGAAPGPVLTAPWVVPGAVFAVRLDPVAAIFVLQVFVGSFLASLYGLAYWRQAEHPRNGRKLRLFFGLLTAGMGTVTVAANAMFFLLGWEVMAISAFLALTTVDERREVREVGYVYIVATHVGTLSLFAMFTLIESITGSFAFGGVDTVAHPVLASGVFVLALLGFGLKAGIMPLHVWLPGAHARAPTHVSAVMSGILLKMGVYGLVRVGAMLSAPPVWPGAVVLGLGCVSAVLGVAFAIGQHDLKRLLAYHSVENVGIIFMGLGVALIGKSVGRPELVALGLAGALLHTWNHGIFKALLFFGAGSVIHATGTQEIDHLGGVGRRMPVTAVLFLVGATAICGLPPLNGFVSELLVYLGLGRSLSGINGTWWIFTAFAIPTLALVGALASACFAKAFGAVFLGSGRSEHADHGHEPSWPMIVPMVVLAALCVVIGVAPGLFAPALDGAVAAWSGGATHASLAQLAPLSFVSLGASVLLAVIGLGALWLRRRLRQVATTGTWDCGYAAPTARMQYTSSSFAQNLTRLFAFVLWPRTRAPVVSGSFPARTSFESEVPDAVLDRLMVPALRAVERVMVWLRWIQAGNVHLYLTYIVAAIVLLLLWRP